MKQPKTNQGTLFKLPFMTRPNAIYIVVQMEYMAFTGRQ